MLLSKDIKILDGEGRKWLTAGLMFSKQCSFSFVSQIVNAVKQYHLCYRFGFSSSAEPT